MAAASDLGAPFAVTGATSIWATWPAPAVRELRELVRYRAKPVALRPPLKAQVHAVMAKERDPARPG